MSQMRAVSLDFGQRRVVQHEVAAPVITRDDQVLFRVEEVGVCGADRELASFHMGYPPAGESHLVLGHEAVGRVIDVGGAVETLRPGDWVVPTIRARLRAAMPLVRARP